MKNESKKLIKKFTLLFGGIYICGLVGLAGYNIITDKNCYFNQKNIIKAAVGRVGDPKDNNKVITASEGTRTQTKDNSAGQANTSPTTATNTTTTTNSNTKDEDYSSVKFARVLNEGTEGEDVKKLQYLLKKKGYYNGDITGKFDNNTTKALVKYQQDKKLAPADGVLGKVTWGTLTE